MTQPVTQVPPPADRSIAQLLRDLSDGTVLLIRQEIRLARTETFESVLSLRTGALWIGGGLGLALAAGGALVAFLILGLAQLLDGRTWLAALIVSVALGLVGWLCMMRGIESLSSARLAPRATATSIRETAEWLKHPTRSAAS